MLQYNGEYTKEGLICGLIGGIGNYLLQIHTVFWINVLQAMFTALLCGAAGVAGKEVYLYVKRKLKSKNEKTVR